MKKPRLAIALGLAVFLIILVVGVAVAARSASFTINWQVLSGGGAPAASTGNVSLNGSLGQTAIGSSSSASYSLNAGYWLKAPGYKILLPVVMKNQ